MTKRKRFDRDFAPYRRDQAMLDPNIIEIDPTQNPRGMDSPGTRENIRGLKLSIATRGVEQPVLVRYDTTTGIPTLVHGECRVRACRELWREGKQILVPATKVSGDEAERLVMNLTANSGLPLTALEIGISCKRLVNYGKTTDQIAAELGKPIRYVTEAIALADAPIAVKQMVTAGQVSQARALQAISELGDNAAEALGQAVAKHAAEPNHKPGPLPRLKAPGTSQRALQMADDLARLVMLDRGSAPATRAAALTYTKARSG